MINLNDVNLGWTRQEFQEFWGEPTSKSKSTRSQYCPLIYKYGNYEVAFGTEYYSRWVYIMKMPEHKIVASNNLETS